VNIFICQQTPRPLPFSDIASSSLAFRGDILLAALLADIAELGTFRVSILREPALGHLPNLPAGVTVVPMHAHNAEETIEVCFEHADAVWPLAPESNGWLESISRKAIQHKKILLGSSRDAVHLASSKYRCSQALRASGIPVVSTFRAQATLPEAHAWVVKPDDGAGCSDTHLFSHQTAATEWIAAQHQGDYVLQPYISGRPCSMSILCGNDGEVHLLSCNDQRMAVSDNQFHYLGSVVNSMEDPNGEFGRLARRVIDAIPGLWGYVGIDFIITREGPIVLEVNPRMTIPHAGLRASMGANPARMLFDILRMGHCVGAASLKRRQISVDLGACQNGARLAV
jgi:predicted ATP-grasp superfamily ATP-dependent carboligase